MRYYTDTRKENSGKCRSNPWPCGALSLVAKGGGERGPGRLWLGRIKLKEAGREVRMTAK